MLKIRSRLPDHHKNIDLEDIVIKLMSAAILFASKNARLLGVPLLLPLMLSGCPNPLPPAAVISYHIVGMCNGYQAPDGSVFSVGPNQAYVFYDVTEINNQNSDPFNFDPSLLYTTSTMRDSVDPGLSVYADIFGPFSLPATTIPGNSDIPYAAGYEALVVQTAAADGASEADHTPYPLDYATPANSVGVIMSQTDIGRTSWPYTPDCGTIVLQ